MGGTAPPWNGRIYQAQSQALFLLLLVLGQEAQSVSAATAEGGRSSREEEVASAEGEQQERWDELFAAPDADVERLAQYGGTSAAPRSLAVPPISGWSWPTSTTLSFFYTLTKKGVVVGNVTSINTGTQTEVIVLASGCREAADGGAPVLYRSIEIRSPGTQYVSAYENGAIKLVSSADRYLCYNPDYKVPVGIAARQDSAAAGSQQTLKGDLGLSTPPLALKRTTYSGNDEALANKNSKIVFMWGGIYSLCYTADGSFDEATNFKENVAPIRIKVLGVRSPCNGGPASSTKADGCIEKERWECFFSYEADGSVQNCILNFKDDGARSGWSVTAGDRSKLTWSETFGSDTLSAAGQLSSATSTQPKYCAVDAPGTAGIFNQAVSGDIIVADALTAATLPAVRSNHSTAFAVAACYCPSYSMETGEPCINGVGAASDVCCEKHVEFIQMVGVIYFWTIRICDMTNYDGVRVSGSSAGCATPYRRVLPQQKFVLRLECPPGGGCENTGNNLIKYVDITADSPLPSWKDQHPCKTSAEPASVVWPTASASETLSGGARVDYKVWYAQPVKINKSVKKDIDVCYSNSNSPTYFFKVGTIKTIDAFAFASKHPAHWDVSNVVNKSTVKYAGYQGSFTLYSGISGVHPSPYDSNLFSGKAMTYFLSYDREKFWGTGTLTTLEKYLGYDKTWPFEAQRELDSECQKFSYSTYLIDTNPLPLAQVAGASNDNDVYQTFSGTGKNQFVKVNLAGVIAVCYCAIVSDSNSCEIPTNWIYGGRMTIHGPSGDKQWVFDTEVVVKLEVNGWGLSSNDRLRIIPNTNNCEDNNGNPVGALSFKTGCPATDGLACTFAVASTTVPLVALSGPGSPGSGQSNTITAITVFNDYSQLEFKEPIQGLLQPGDVITIDYDSVIINGKDKVDELPWEKYETYKLTGEYDYQDTISAGQVLKKYVVGHTVSQVINGGIVEPNKLSIPIGWLLAGRPAFTFPAIGGQPGGRWTRRNKVQTAETLKGMALTGLDLKVQTAETLKGMALTGLDLKVCWGVFDAGISTFYKQAGTLKFITPEPMAQAQIFLTTKQANALAPTIIYFGTSPTRTDYATSGGKTKLMLRFLDVRNEDGKLVPYFAQDVSYICQSGTGCPTELKTPDFIDYENAQQFLCGKLFSELWTEDSEGFPVPKGCYYSNKYRDGPNDVGGDPTANTNNFFREVTIVFHNKNGLKANTKYMLVMNTRNPVAVDPGAGAVPAVDLVTMCAEELGCDRPYKVFEKSRANIQTKTVQRGSDLNNPRFGEGGFDIISPYVDGDPNKGTLNLSEMNIMQFKLTGGAGQKAIKPQAIIRVILWPLTQWSIGQASCTAQCVPFDENSAAQCRGAVGCTPEAVVTPALLNAYQVVKIRLPTDMTDITDITKHTVKVLSLTLPRGGFFPTRTGVQLTKDDDTDPSYLTSKGMIWKYPEEGRTEGRLVLTGATGSGPKPFVGDANNKLVVRLQFGATLWNWGDSSPAAIIELTLPPDYSCNVVGLTGLAGQPSADMDVFKVDSNSDDYPDNRRGLLSTLTADGNYARSAGRTCYYELFKYNRIYARQVIYIELDVVNPSSPFRKDLKTNQWEIKLSSKGAFQTPTDFGLSMPAVKFTNNSVIALIPDGPTYFAGNAAVIKELVKPLFQPGSTLTSMTRSCCGSTFSQRRTQQYMRVFFKPGVSVGQRGYVIVDAPNLFDFGETCTVRDLQSDYYAFAGAEELVLKPLKPPLVCAGNRNPPLTATTYNRARIRVGGLVDVIDRTYYGFEVMVTHPTSYNTLMSENWKLWLEDAQGYSLEGSRDTVKMNPLQAPTQTLFYHKSWGMYNDYMDNIRITVQNLRPYVISDSQDSKITIWPIIFTEATQTSLRITAPLGFVWNTDTNNFLPTTNCTESEPCEAFGGGSGVLPVVEGTVENTIIFSQVYFNPNVKYGFQHKIRIPNFNPRTSANSFFFEFGYEKAEINSRLRAVVIEAPRVAAMLNCKVGFNSNQVGFIDNRIQFEFQTMSIIGANAGIVITGDVNTRGFTFTPEYVLLEGSDKLPSDVTMLAGKEPDQTPKIQIKVQGTPIYPGLYKIELKVANPEGRIVTPAQWTFGSYNDVSQYPTKYYLDNEMVTPGFVINDRMQFAGFYSVNARQKKDTGREDRPGYMNQLIFEFELRKRPNEIKEMLLKAPHGFEFEDDCLGPSTDPRLMTDYNTVFGENTGGIWPSGDLEIWPPLFSPTACRGEGRDAFIQLPVGLEMNRRYAYRIRVRNPLNSPEWNKWTINYNDESSDPFPGFNIWTAVGNPTVTPVSYSRNQGGSTDLIVNPVTITFQPYKNVPRKPADDTKGGVLRVEVPAGFSFVQVNSECQVDLRITGASMAVDPANLMCEVDSSTTKLNLYMIGSTEIQGEESGSGQEYQLIVYVYNPIGPQAAADWHLNTFSKWTREPEYSLDESSIPGFAVINDLWRFTVVNTMMEVNGNKPVSEVEIVVNFRDNVKDGDQIILYAPVGFNIVSNPETNECNNYRPVGASPDWFPFTGQPECKCEEVGPKCYLTWQKIKEGKDPAFAQKQDIRFKIATRNPSKTPSIAANFWLARHISVTGTLLGEQVAASWAINPQLANVAINFANGYRSAESQANLNFVMTPVNDACCIEIQAEYPTEFDFTQSTVFSNYDILAQEGSRMVINMRTPGFQQDKELKFTVFNVRLGRGGGQTRWNIVTYADSKLLVKRDEVLQYEGGFRLPGKVTVLGTPDLTSAYKESRLMFPVKSLFQPRVSEWATAEFRVQFSQPVYSTGNLVISCQGAGDSPGYLIKTDGFVIIGTGQIAAIPVIDKTTGGLKATLKPSRPASEVALMADTPYTVSLRVYPQSAGVNTWRFDTTDAKEGFTNTNDGNSNGFNPVERFLLTVTVVRSPPKAIIEVILDVDQGSSVIRELLIIAPPGFLFDAGPDGCGDMCMPGQALGSTGRRTATLASPTGQPLTVLTGLRIRVQTPEQTPIGSGSEGVMWFVEGRGQGAGTTKGWGEGPGFPVTQMAGSAVYYAGIANLRAHQIVFTFTLDVDAGSTISVVPPAGFLLTCSMEGALKTISLPGGRPNCIDDPLQLQLREPLTRGTYAFAVTVDLPPQKPQVNTFNIIIQDQYNNVVDAAYGVFGQEIMNMPAERPTLGWSRAEPGQPTMITVGITFREDVSSLQALLIVLPELFQHDVQIPIDVQNYNPRFPLAPGLDWADTQEPDRIKIFLDDSEDVTVIPADTYRFSFPALMPPDVPRKNIWFICLCADRSCKQPGDRQVAVSFPIAGFNLYEVAAQSTKASASPAKRRALPSIFGAATTMLALVVLSAFSL